MLYPPSTLRILRAILISLFCFLLPAVYIDTHTTIWTSRLTAAAIRPSPKEATLLIRGLSLPSVTPPAVAVCIAQETQTMPQSSMYYIDRHVLRVLKHAGYSVHVFLFLPRPQSKSHLSPTIQTAVRVLQPVSIIYHSRRTACQRTPCSNSSGKCLFTLLHPQQCHNHIVAYERRVGLTFNWVYKTQLSDISVTANITESRNLANDMAITNQRNPNETKNEHSGLKMIPDRSDARSGSGSRYVFAATRSTADSVFNAVETFRECTLYDLPTAIAYSEVGFLSWFVSNGVKNKTAPWFWMFVDRSSDPDCDHAHWMRNENGIHDPSLKKLCLRYIRTNYSRI